MENPCVELRRVEVKRGDEWEVVRLSEVKKGDTFRMFDGDTPVVSYSIFDGRELTEYEALGDAYQNENFIWTVNVSIE